MPTPTLRIDSQSYDHDAGGWVVHVQIVSSDGSTRTGPEFIALPDTATSEEILAALAALYP